MQDELLQKVKIDLRFSHNKLDDDLQDNINSCIEDLKRVGIFAPKTNPLIVQAVKLYCRWRYDFNKQGDRYYNAYEKMRESLSLYGEFK